MTLVLRNEEKIENQLEINSTYGKGIMYVTTNAIVLEQKTREYSTHLNTSELMPCRQVQDSYHNSFHTLLQFF